LASTAAIRMLVPPKSTPMANRFALSVIQWPKERGANGNCKWGNRVIGSSGEMKSKTKT
jgi:hypothetical protein